MNDIWRLRRGRGTCRYRMYMYTCMCREGREGDMQIGRGKR